MSTIHKLSIRGIRSYGSEHCDEQIIRFESPVTLILGQNGCGKTAIIECIKYALTGETPPGARGNNKGFFVHDPKIFDIKQCLARVILEVENSVGKTLTVSRALQTTFNRNGKKTCTTLETVVSYKDQNGVKKQLNQNIDEANEVISREMNVSSAIVNNVLFCHQEDSSWPLGDDKVVKERFDAIFDTEKYNVVIDKLLKMRKSYEIKLKDNESNLRLATYRKEEADKKRLELSKLEENVNDTQAAYTRCDQQLIPINKTLEELTIKESDAKKVRSEIAMLKMKIDHCLSQQEDKRRNITKFEADSIEAIQIKLESFNTDQKVKQRNLNIHKDDLERVTDKLNSIKKEIAELNGTLKANQRKTQSKDELLNRNRNNVRKICKLLKISTQNMMENEQQIEELLPEIQDKSEEFKREFDEMPSQLAKIEDDYQQKIDKLKDEKAVRVTEISSKTKQTSQLGMDITRLNSRISEVEASATKLKTINDKVEHLTSELSNLEATSDLPKMKEKMISLKTKQNGLQKQSDKLESLLATLSKLSGIKAQIDGKQKQVDNLENEKMKLERVHMSDLKKLFADKNITSDFKRNVQIVMQKHSNTCTQLTSKIESLEKKRTEYERDRKNKKDTLNGIENELKDTEERIYDVCHGESYENVLAEVSERVTKSQMEHGAIKSSQVFYEKYIDKLDSDDCCPLCTTKLTESGVRKLQQSLRGDIEQLPESINEAEQTMNNVKSEYEEVLSLKHLIERNEKFKKDISDLRKSISELDEKIKSCTSAIKQANNDIEGPRKLKSIAENLVSDMQLLDRTILELGVLNSELNGLKNQLPANCPDDSLEDVQMEKSVINAELADLRKQLDVIGNNYDEATTMINERREERNKMKDEQLRLQEGLQSISELRERRDAMKKSVMDLKECISTLDEELKPIEKHLFDTNNSREKARNDYKTRYNALKLQFKDITDLQNKICHINKEIAEINQIILESADINEQIISLNLKEKESGIDVAQKQEIVNQLRDELNNQIPFERNLKDNIALKELMIEEKNLQVKLEPLERNLSSMDIKAIQIEYDRTMKQRDEVTSKRSQLHGRLQELNRQLDEVRTVLEAPKFRNALRDFNMYTQAVAVTQLLIADLKSVRTSLEWSIASFHNEKMKNINRLIRQLWREIYRGNDIDYIEIKTDEDKIGSSDSKRVFNYRVVQHRHNTEMDMRAQCSAGQKVLACLIIRIALAETFSRQCAVMSLDEPTTNLDTDNIQSLCVALNRLVESRQVQRNFMLIIISHDEKFMRTLDHIECYYKVSRQRNGKSKITQLRIETN